MISFIIKDDHDQSYLEKYLITLFVLVSVQNDIGISTEEFSIIFFRPICNLEKIIHIIQSEPEGQNIICLEGGMEDIKKVFAGPKKTK